MAGRGDTLVHRWLDPRVDADLSRWQALLERTRHDFHQLPAYLTLEAERLGGHALALLVEHPGSPERAAMLPLILRRLPNHGGVDAIDAISPYGYPGPVFAGCDRAAAVQAFVASMATRGVVSAFVRLHPLLDDAEQALARHGSVVEHGPTVWINLEADESAQRAGYRSTHRNLIRRAQREGQRVSFDDDFARLDEFFPIYAQTMRRLVPTWTDTLANMGRAYLERLAELLRGRGFLALVEHEGVVIGGGVFSACSGIVQYHLSGTATAWQRASPSRLLLDEVRRRQAARGDWRMHLGGGVGAQEDPLFQFKRGFSPDRGRFCSWRVIPNPELYTRLVADWASAGGSREAAGGFFPLYRAPIVANRGAHS